MDMNGKASREEIDGFILEYNRRVGWNVDLRNSLNMEFVRQNESTSNVVDRWLHTGRIYEYTPYTQPDKNNEVIDTKTSEAEIFERTEPDGRVVRELHAFNVLDLGYTSYFINVGETEAEYKAGRLSFIREHISQIAKRDRAQIIESMERERSMERLLGMIDTLETQNGKEQRHGSNS